MSDTISTIIFDADHTLYTPESDAAYDAKFRFLAKQTGTREERLRKAWDNTIQEAQESSDPGEWERKSLITDTLERAGVEPDSRVVEDAYSVFWENVANETHASGDVVGMLRQLKKHGFNLAIATDEFPEPLRIKLGTVLHSTDVDDMFDIIVTPKDTETQKPSERFYRIIMDEVDAFRDETIVVGDSWERDLRPAKQLDMITVLVQDEVEDTDDNDDENDDGTGLPGPESEPPYDEEDSSGYRNMYTENDDGSALTAHQESEFAATDSDDGPDYRITTVTDVMKILNERDLL